MTALGEARIIQGNALDLPLEDASVDLVCTSPPYFGLRSYQDGCPDCDGQGKAKRPDSHGMKFCPDCGNVANRKRCNRCGASMKWPPRAEQFTASTCGTCSGTGKGHYQGQIGSEATPAEFLDALLAATREMVRVLKPSGSIFVNLGDKYVADNRGSGADIKRGEAKYAPRGPAGYVTGGMRQKSLMGIPWRYAIACIDQLGLILRAEIIWAKPNGLPESVTDRVRRSHEQWFHLVKQPRYFAAVDEIREEHDPDTFRSTKVGLRAMIGRNTNHGAGGIYAGPNPLGKLPGSVWTIPTQPLTVPPELGVDHFAAYPMEWPRRIIQGWTPTGICTACGQGRRPILDKQYEHCQNRFGNRFTDGLAAMGTHGKARPGSSAAPDMKLNATITGYMCGCATPTAPTRPSVCLDPFGGTGTTALVAKALGRTGITVDLSADYCRLAQWRCNNPQELAAALQVEKPDVVPTDQLSLFGDLA